jgi:hypothetical protein
MQLVELHIDEELEVDDSGLCLADLSKLACLHVLSASCLLWYQAQLGQRACMLCRLICAEACLQLVTSVTSLSGSVFLCLLSLLCCIQRSPALLANLHSEIRSLCFSSSHLPFKA